MRIALVAVVFILAGAAFDTAKADHYRWCADYGGARGGSNCYFVTLEQCRWTISGITAASCQPNPFYDGPVDGASTSPRAKRRGRDARKSSCAPLSPLLLLHFRRRGVRRQRTPIRTAGARNTCGGALGGASNCYFITLEQCRATVSGVGGFCTPNPFYDGLPSARRAARRGKRRGQALDGAPSMRHATCSRSRCCSPPARHSRRPRPIRTRWCADPQRRPARHAMLFHHPAAVPRQRVRASAASACQIRSQRRRRRRRAAAGNARNGRVFMRIALAAVALLAAGSTFDAAKADPYRWCASTTAAAPAARNCYFITLEQCRADDLRAWAPAPAGPTRSTTASRSTGRRAANRRAHGASPT